MMVQFTEGLPGLVKDGDRVFFDTTAADLAEQLTEFYTHYLAFADTYDKDALDLYGLSSEYAAGFGPFIARLERQTFPLRAVKGQVTGPFTFGTNLVDQDRRCAYYDEQLRDVVVKMVSLKALWQIERLKHYGVPVLMFLDEPALLGFGSQTFLTISRDDVLRDLNEVAAMIHAAGALAGVHCEENTDWSLLMESDLDVLDFDAYDHAHVIALYPQELRTFLSRGGCLGWGIVPTLDRDAAATATIPSLLERLEEGMTRLATKGFDRELLLLRALITPSCGAGGVLTEALAERVLRLLQALSRTLREKFDLVD
jgi:hypothetical protein